MGNLIVIVVVGIILALALKPIIKHNKQKGKGDFGCYSCSRSSDCSGCNNK